MCAYYYHFRGKNVLNQKSELQKALSKHKEKQTLNQVKEHRETPGKNLLFSPIHLAHNGKIIVPILRCCLRNLQTLLSIFMVLPHCTLTVLIVNRFLYIDVGT